MEVRTCLYRIVQESIANALKYADTQALLVSIIQDEKKIHVKIQDWGMGFDINMYKNSIREKGSNGIRNMKERVWLLNGTFEISSEMGKGTKISVNIPL